VPRSSLRARQTQRHGLLPMALRPPINQRRLTALRAHLRGSERDQRTQMACGLVDRTRRNHRCRHVGWPVLVGAMTTVSDPTPEVRRQARQWAAYDRYGQQTRTPFPSAWFVAVAIAALAIGTAFAALPAHIDIQTGVGFEVCPPPC